MPGVYNKQSSGGGSIAIKDEGITVTAAASSLDFTGAGVTASAVGNAATANISGNSVSVAYDELPSGAINGTNDTFTLAHTPSPANSLDLILGGQTLTGGGEDYTLSTATITMAAGKIPQVGDVFRAKSYTY